MKAMVLRQARPVEADLLELIDIPVSTPGNREILLKLLKTGQLRGAGVIQNG